ncbi:hypothetical protein V8D89_015800 [Ganoderma adspersum]
MPRYTVISGSANSTTIPYDAGSEHQLLAHEWVVHMSGVDRPRFSLSPDGQFMASSGNDNAVTIWAVRLRTGSSSSA